MQRAAWQALEAHQRQIEQAPAPTVRRGPRAERFVAEAG
jgi:hypothetical protein